MAFCKACGKPLDNDARFCPNCGTAIASEPVQPAPVQPAPTEPVSCPVSATNLLVFGILGLAFALELPILGIIFSAIALNKAKQYALYLPLTGKAKVGRSLGKAGLIVGIVMTVLVALLIVYYIVFGVVYAGIMIGIFEDMFNSYNYYGYYM